MVFLIIISYCFAKDQISLYAIDGSIKNGYWIFLKESSFLVKFATGLLNDVSVCYLYNIRDGEGREVGDYTLV